ncbi:MAG TPA: RDD family protein, partial [Tepidisphaeraceae bacterium]|nr:RDD family protein [Tepidisphaeraceae bacterium]
IEPPLRARIQTEWRADYVLSLIMIMLWLLYSSLEMIVAATPGKILLDLRIARVDGVDAPRSTLVMRWSTKQLPAILMVFQMLTFSDFLAALSSLTNFIVCIGCLQMLDENRLSWLDQWAHTAVIRERAQKK